MQVLLLQPQLLLLLQDSNNKQMIRVDISQPQAPPTPHEVLQSQLSVAQLLLQHPLLPSNNTKIIGNHELLNIKPPTNFLCISLYATKVSNVLANNYIKIYV